MGSATNRTRDGKTSQKTLVESALTLSTLFVSMYSQSMANTETNGIEARIAPTKLLRFAISEIATIKTVVTAIFTR